MLAGGVWQNCGIGRLPSSLAAWVVTELTFDSHPLAERIGSRPTADQSSCRMSIIRAGFQLTTGVVALRYHQIKVGGNVNPSDAEA